MLAKLHAECHVFPSVRSERQHQWRGRGERHCRGWPAGSRREGNCRVAAYIRANVANICDATTSPAQTVTITNNLATSVSPSIVGSGDYAAVQVARPVTAPLLAHATCTFTVTFVPSAVGTRASAVTVTDSANPSVQIVSVSGTGQ